MGWCTFLLLVGCLFFVVPWLGGIGLVVLVCGVFSTVCSIICCAFFVPRAAVCGCLFVWIDDVVDGICLFRFGGGIFVVPGL